MLRGMDEAAAIAALVVRSGGILRVTLHGNRFSADELDVAEGRRPAAVEKVQVLEDTVRTDELADAQRVAVGAELASGATRRPRTRGDAAGFVSKVRQPHGLRASTTSTSNLHQ
jgi:hypothetical protein